MQSGKQKWIISISQGRVKASRESDSGLHQVIQPFLRVVSALLVSAIASTVFYLVVYIRGSFILRTTVPSMVSSIYRPQQAPELFEF